MAPHSGSLLDALQAFRRAHPAVSVMNVIAYLHISENEGLNVTELAALCRTTCATASRTAASLCGRTGGADRDLAPLAEVRPNPRNGVSKVLYLTPEGRRLRATLDQITACRRPIALVGGVDYKAGQAG